MNSHTKVKQPLTGTEIETVKIAEKVKCVPSHYKSPYNLHLVSLPPVSDKSPKVLRDIWKWKDIVLGDGRDYFIPRPRALRALSEILVGSSISISTEEGLKNTFKISECAVLSNCARMDVLLVLDKTCCSDLNEESFLSKELMNQVAKAIVSLCMLEQLKSFQNQRKQRGSTSSILVEGLSSVLDLPGMVDTTIGMNGKLIVCIMVKRNGSLSFCNSVKSQIWSIDDSISEFYPLLHGTYDTVDIMNHFSTVAAGIAPRASRPDRRIIFRPFSSRDAHIMLQLKRTAEVANNYAIVKVVLDCALTAGKAARDIKICPIIEKLKPYSAEGKYSQEPPPNLEKAAIESVTELAIEPVIEKCIIRLNAMRASEQIIQFNRKMEEMLIKYSNPAKKQMARKMMHPILCQLRIGNFDIDITTAVRDIENYLLDMK